jgi:uncharacterized repeat protein (TIGR02543 family)
MPAHNCRTASMSRRGPLIPAARLACWAGALTRERTLGFAKENEMHSHRFKSAGLAPGLLMLTLALSGPTAYGQAQTFVVDSVLDIDDGDFSPGNLTLREAIGLANANDDADVIGFDPALAGATILLTQGQLEIRSSITINGPGADLLTVSAGGASRVISEEGSGPRNITLRDLTLADGLGPAPSAGGALFSNSGNITLERVVMRNNNSLSANGSTIVVAFGTLNMKDCAIVENLDTGIGALRLQDSQATIVNTTISNNRTRAISLFGSSASRAGFLSLTNVTISGNLGDGMEIVAHAGTTDFEYQNTVFADNGNANIVARGNDLPGLSITSLGNNLLDDSPAGDAAHSAAAGDLRNTDPLLDTLDDYGGATFTMRPLPGSLALDAGLCFADDPLVPESDQRGVARPQGEGCDIGAAELARIGVVFEANGGAPAPGGQVVLEGDLITEPGAMTRPGFRFEGWYATPDFSGAPWNFASDTAPFDALELFARWEADALFSDGFE